MSKLLLSGSIAVALALSPVASQAQQNPAYSLDQLKILIQGGLPATAILRRTAQDCLAFRVDDDAVRQLQAAGANAQLIDGLRSACVRLPEAAKAPPPVRTDSVRPPGAVRADTARAPARDTARAPGRAESARRTEPPPAQPPASEAEGQRLYSPGGAAVKSLILPGLGQFGTRRPVLGALFMGGAAGALAIGLMSSKTTIDCLARTTDGTCPSGQSRSEVSEKTMLVPGLAAFVALGVVSALEAASGAKRANASHQAWAPTGEPAARLELIPKVAADRGGRTDLSLVRLRF